MKKLIILIVGLFVFIGCEVNVRTEETEELEKRIDNIEHEVNQLKTKVFPNPEDPLGILDELNNQSDSETQATIDLAEKKEADK